MILYKDTDYRPGDSMCSDETLAAGVQQGSKADMQTLVERYYEPLLRFLFWLSGGNQAQAEDMVQEAFLRMMRGIASYDPSRPFKPWLYAIAEHIARNQAQRADARLTESMLGEAVYLDHLPLPEEHVEAGEMRQVVADGLSKLPVQQREVIALFFYENLPQKEIAETLGIPVGTVKSRLSLGLKQLRAWIGVKWKNNR
jgi:RNA polymerase sigma-70 factor, ECF subfamily